MDGDYSIAITNRSVLIIAKPISTALLACLLFGSSGIPLTQ